MLLDEEADCGIAHPHIGGILRRWSGESRGRPSTLNINVGVGLTGDCSGGELE